MTRSIRIAFLILLIAASASAQVWRGQGRVAGKVTDEAGKPIEGVVVKLGLPTTTAALEAKTNSKGEWAVAGIAGGGWQVDFTKSGYEPRNITVPVEELSRLAPVEITMKKAADPNEIIATELKRAADLMTEKKYVEARGIYDALLVRFPTAYRIEQLVARAYYLEGQPEKAIERLKAVTVRDPNSQEAKLLLGSLLLEMGRADEGKQVLGSVDDAKITDPAIYVNFGIAMMNKNQPVEAAGYFEKSIVKFPAAADAYYYHGLTLLQMANTQGEEAQKAERLDRAKADLAKFLELAPKAPEAETARKILEQIK
jgi:tetratricopeptide (TPR) repeat protein